MKRPRRVTVGLLFACLAVGLFVVARRPALTPGRLPVIVDTDAGTDDLIALAYLLSRHDVDVQLITSVNGLAHADAGARNVLRLLRSANRRIPVHVGHDQPLEGRAAFPAEWREQADAMAALPPQMGRRPRADAVSAILDRLRSSTTPLSVLALGPLTNLAAAVAREPQTMSKVAQVVIMGGALSVAGNAPFGADSPAAEWNFYVDPAAASLVFKAGLPILLVPLDATNRVPIDRSFVNLLAAHRPSAIGRTVERLLESNDEMIRSHSYFAWDPLAAVALVEPAVVRTAPMRVSVVRSGEYRGRVVEEDQDQGGANALVATSAASAAFRRTFLGALTQRGPG